MQKGKLAGALGVGVALVFIAGNMAGPALAQKPFLERIRKKYMLDKTNGKCDLCHEVKPKEEPSRKNLNSFGKAIQDDPEAKPLLGKDADYKFTKQDLDLVEKIVGKLEYVDSDGDGAFNKEELELGFMPGDAKNTPTKAQLAKYRKDHPLPSGVTPPTPKTK